MINETVWINKIEFLYKESHEYYDIDIIFGKMKRIYINRQRHVEFVYRVSDDV